MFTRAGRAGVAVAPDGMGYDQVTGVADAELVGDETLAFPGPPGSPIRSADEQTFGKLEILRYGYDLAATPPTYTYTIVLGTL